VRSFLASLAVAATVFALLFPAELPDKTALASLILGSRYRTGFVFAGIAAALAVHVAFAVALGSLLTLLPHRAVEAVVVLFLAGALLLLRGRRGHGDDYVSARESRTSFWRVAATSFTVILVAEFGDLTQILTAGLAARYHDPVAVGIGSVLALWSVAAIAITVGRGLLKVIPLIWITRAAAAVMLILAGASLAAAIW
jgi:putative Ca2+/H+ antiporter (TMEM165/GDT1 family)